MRIEEKLKLNSTHISRENSIKNIKVKKNSSPDILAICIFRVMSPSGLCPAMMDEVE